jgi:ABC-type transport system involved in cytochrome c biogenesis ATPase subunit
MQDKRASKVKTFHNTLKDTAHISRWICQLIVHIAELWLADAPVTTIHKPHNITTVQRTLLYAAIQEQGRIGWDSFVRGRISTKWTKAIAARYQAEDREYFQ